MLPCLLPNNNGNSNNIVFLNFEWHFLVTCQLRVRSICPATYEASPESSACKKNHTPTEKESVIEELLMEIEFSIEWHFTLTWSILPRSNPSKFFNVKYGGKVNLHQEPSKCEEHLMQALLYTTLTQYIHTPVLDISFPATKPWSVHSQSNGFETSLFSSSHKLCHNIPILVHLNKQ